MTQSQSSKFWSSGTLNYEIYWFKTICAEGEVIENTENVYIPKGEIAPQDDVFVLKKTVAPWPRHLSTRSIRWPTPRQKFASAGAH